ncbi:STAS domain-containing protein [Streptomyces sp. NPDC026206]|uniref:STAS domain-containing protein n=1 Tax=Streptomyces sp. NPDC026206 TaxID=3157089 RepID=UPI0033F90B54
MHTGSGNPIIAEDPRAVEAGIPAFTPRRSSWRASRVPVTDGQEGRTVIAVGGRLDLATVPRLRRRLLRVSRTPGSRLILDLSGVTSCDALGLGLLVAEGRRARCYGGELRLVAPRPAVVKALGASGLSRLLPVFPDIKTAARSAVVQAPVP